MSLCYFDLLCFVKNTFLRELFCEEVRVEDQPQYHPERSQGSVVLIGQEATQEHRKMGNIKSKYIPFINSDFLFKSDGIMCVM